MADVLGELASGRLAGNSRIWDDRSACSEAT